MLETNKQAFLFNFGLDLSYFVILRYKLRDLIKIYDDFVTDLIEGAFQETFSGGLVQVIPGNLQKYVSTNRSLLQCKTLPPISVLI